MTLKDKKNKREYNRKLKAEGGPSSDAKEKPASKKKDDKTQKASSNFSGVTETADKLITEANKRFEKAEQIPTSDGEKKYAKRNIVSNWAKYEIPDDDEVEDDQEKTGPDFEYVLSTAQGSEAHFIFKSEQEWVKEAGNIGELSEEFFSLDIPSLEACIMKIPFHKQIGLNEEEIEPEFLSRIKTMSHNANDLSVSSQEVEKEVSQKMLNILSFKEKEAQPTLPTSLNEDKAKEKEINSDLKSVPTDIQTEKVEKKESLKPSDVSAAPLEQRQNRRQRGSKNIKKVEKEASENEDLKFIEDIGKAGVGEKIDEHPDDKNAVISNVVPVIINSTEKQNLEDWLDDFLDD